MRPTANATSHGRRDASRRWAASPPLSVVVSIALAVGLMACSGTSTGGAAPTAASAPGGGPAVAIKDFAYVPASLTIAAGTTVTWTNQDVAAHSVTAVDGSFDSKTIAQGSTFSWTFASPGTYSYTCTFHSDMKGTIVVR